GLITAAAEVSDQLRDRWEWITSQATFAILAHYQSQFTQSVQFNQSVYAAARVTGNLVQQGWGLYSQAESLMRLGRLDEALALLEQSLTLLTGDIRRAAPIRVHGTLAVTHWRRGEVALAEQVVDTASHLIAQSNPTIYSAMEAYNSVAETALGLWEKALTEGEPDQLAELQARARQACRVIQRYARLYPVGQPRAHLWSGLYAWLEGKPKAAHRAWSRSLAYAQRLGMPYEEGLAHYEIARHLDLGDPARQPHLTRACEIFAELNAEFDLERARKLSTETTEKDGSH